MAAALDSNRKIREGGRNARDVYLWVLRQVALRDSDGDIPLADVTSYRHVAEQGMCSEAEAREGFESAVTVALLAVIDDRCVVVGWDGDWGRRAMSGAERVAKWREKHTNRRTLTGMPPVDVTDRYSVTDDVTRNAGEERRGEERESRVTSNAAGGLVDPLRLETPQRAVKAARARQVKHPLPDDWTPNLELVAEAKSLGIDPLDQATRMRDWARAEGAKKCDWDATFRNWIRRKADEPPRRGTGTGRPQEYMP
jgi:hypothetical protein